MAGRALKVLVIEDDPDDAVLIQSALDGQGWEIDFADSGNEGLARVKLGDYDAVVLDYRLRDMTGTEVLLRLMEKNRNLPVIMASGMDSMFITARALALGARGFVNKDDADFEAELGSKVAEAVGQPAAAKSSAAPAVGRETVKARATQVKQILGTLMGTGDLVSAVGIVGPDGAMIHSAVQDSSGAQDVTAVLAGTAQMMLSTAANHLGYGEARSFVASFEKGQLAMAPLTGGLVLYVTTGSGPAVADQLRRELESVVLELNQILAPRT